MPGGVLQRNLEMFRPISRAAWAWWNRIFLPMRIRSPCDNERLGHKHKSKEGRGCAVVAPNGPVLRAEEEMEVPATFHRPTAKTTVPHLGKKSGHNSGKSSRRLSSDKLVSDVSAL